MKKPNFSPVNNAFAMAFLLTVAFVYVGFLKDNAVFLESYLKSGIGITIVVCIIFFVPPWIWCYVQNSRYIKNIDNILEYGKSNGTIPESLKTKILALENLYKTDLITLEEFRKKAVPYCLEVWEIFSEHSSGKMQTDKEMKKAQIIDAFNKGILTEEEKNMKIDSL